jgi:SH3-like domain-containing protein
MFSIRKTLAAGMVALGALIGFSLSAEAQEMTAYTANDLNLRTGPGTQFPVVVVMPQGSPVTVDYCVASEDWCHVLWAGFEGWASTRYLTTTPPQYAQQYPQPTYPQQQYQQPQYGQQMPQMAQPYPQQQIYIQPYPQQPIYAQPYPQQPLIIQPGPRRWVWPYGGFGIWFWGM